MRFRFSPSPGKLKFSKLPYFLEQGCEGWFSDPGTIFRESRTGPEKIPSYPVSRTGIVTPANQCCRISNIQTESRTVFEPNLELRTHIRIRDSNASNRRVGFEIRRNSKVRQHSRTPLVTNRSSGRGKCRHGLYNQK